MTCFSNDHISYLTLEVLGCCVCRLIIMNQGTGCKILAGVTGVVGLGLFFSSVVFLIQVVGYQNPGLLYNNYNYRPYTPGADYYNVSYNLFGYQFDPIIAIAAVSLCIAVLQFFGSFALCCVNRFKSAITGFLVLHVILLLGVVVCFALGFYYEVYLYLYTPNSSYYDANYGFIGPNGNGRLNGYSGYNGLYGYNNNGGNGNLGFNSVYRGLFGPQGYYNQTGQAFLAFLGIDIVVLILAIIISGCVAKRSGYQDRYESNGTLYKQTNVTRM